GPFVSGQTEEFMFGDQLKKIEQIYELRGSVLDEPDRQVKHLSLQECIQRALAHNLDIKIGGYDPVIRLSDVIAAEAAFDAVLFGSVQYDLTDRPNIDSGFTTGTDDQNGNDRPLRFPTDPFIINHDYNYSLGLRKLLPTGASIQLAQRMRRYRDMVNEDDIYRNPYYEMGVQLQVQQPLLRDFGIDVNQASILASRNNYRISRQQFHQQVIEILTQVETNYWRLFFARQRVKIFADLVDRANESLLKIEQRKNYDGKSQVLSRVLAVIKKAEASRISARNTVLQQQNLLLDLLNDPEFPLDKPLEVITTDRPATTSFEIDPVRAVDTALRLRPEILIQELRLDTAGLALGVADNQRLPRLDLVYRQEATGAGDAYYDSWDQQWQYNTVNHLFGLSLEYPFGNRAAEAAFRRARSQQEQQKLELQNVRESVVTDVNITCDKLTHSFTEINYRLEAMGADQGEIDNYRAIQQVESQNAFQPQFINLRLNADERLANSQISALQIMIEYNLAIMDAHRAQGILLRYNNIKLAELGPSGMQD
ncbi:MAG: TolC family protein, partial [Sedimentisphaerales bacterium]|nr:TolC family protein [Sedimentisphaerales bacterium]